MPEPMKDGVAATTRERAIAQVRRAIESAPAMFEDGRDLSSTLEALDWIVSREAVLVALLGQAVEALDIATDALAAGTSLPDRAVSTAKLATATKELRVAVGEAIGVEDGD